MDIELLESKIQKEKDAVTGYLIVLSLFVVFIYVYWSGREKSLNVEMVLYPLVCAHIGLFLVFRKILGFQKDTVRLLKEMKKEAEPAG